MTITIELSAEEETRLLEEAKRQGQAPEGVVYGLIHQGLSALPPKQATLAPVSEDAHEALIQHLLEIGAIAQRPARPGKTVPFKPISVRGRPVSETIIEDRR